MGPAKAIVHTRGGSSISIRLRAGHDHQYLSPSKALEPVGANVVSAPRTRSSGAHLRWSIDWAKLAAARLERCCGSARLLVPRLVLVQCSVVVAAPPAMIAINSWSLSSLTDRADMVVLTA